jgi:fatty-acyl-CoA synthase
MPTAPGRKNVYQPRQARLKVCILGGWSLFGVFAEDTGTEEVVLVAEVDAGEDDRMRIADSIRRRVTQGSAVALRQVHLVERGWLVKTSSGKIARGANREKWGRERDERMGSRE